MPSFAGRMIRRATAALGCMLALAALAEPVLAQTTITRRIAAASDDAEEEGPTGTTPNRMWLNSTDIELVSDFEPAVTGVQKVGLRFTSMTIPAGSIITGAYLRFRAIAADAPMTNADATSLTIRGELTGNPSTFTTTSGNIGGRALTSASASWVPTTWTTGADYDSPSLVSVIQELINQGSWASGNAMAIIITGTGHRASPSWDGDAANAAQLVVTYTLPARTWTGGGADNNWSTAANWDTGTPVGGEPLVFPSGAARLSNTNNLTAGTSFASITISGNGYTLAGNSVVVGSVSDNNAAGSNTIALPIALSGALSISVANAAATLTMSGVLSGAGAPAVSGSGTLVLSGNNSYTGVTTIPSGSTLIAAANNALGTTGGATTITSGGTLGFQGGITYSTVEPVTINGAGVGGAGAILNVSGTNSFAGAVTIASASTFGSTAGTLTISDAFSNGGFLLTATGAGGVTFSGAITGSGGLTKNAAGTLTLSGGNDNTFSGVTTVNDGVVALNKAGKDAYRGPLNVGDAAGSANSAVVRWLAADQVPTNMLITINSDGLLDLNGFSGAIDGLTMTGGNVTTGAGTLTLGNTVTSNAAATSATISGNLALGGNRIFSVADGAAAQDLVVSAVVSGNFDVTKQGAGLIAFSGTNTFTGATTISAGTLSVGTIGNGGVAGNLGAAPTNASNLVLSGGTLQYTGSTASTNRNFILTAATSSSIDVSTGGTTLTISGASTNTTGALTKLGAGVLTLSATNLHTGATTITAGTLQVNGSLSASSAVSLNGGILGGTGTVGAVTSTTSGGSLSPGSPATGPGILNSGNINLSATGTRSLVVQLDGTTVGTNYDQLNVTGTVNLTGASLTGTVGFVPANGATFTIINNDLTDAVTGTFTGLAQGAIVTLSGVDFTISYTGGTGNDVVLTKVVVISGNVFEDVNYGGGAGRSKATASGVNRSGVRVELYTSGGVFSTFTTTDVNGDYSFAGLAAGTYYVRVVNSSVSSSRTGYTSSALAVQTYRNTAASGSAVDVTDFVGGTNPAVADPGNGSAGATFNTTTFVYSAVLSGTAQSVAPVVVSTANITGIDFGFNFNTIVNTNNTGQGSLRQFIDNANLLGADGSLAQAGLPSGRENAVFMLSNGTTAAGLRSTNNYFSGGIATISPNPGLPTISTPMVLDAQRQPGWTSTPIIELNGTSAGASQNGLTVTAGATVIRGLIINRFTNHGISLLTAGADTVQGNYVGLNAAGTAASANTVHGIIVDNIGATLIGGTTATTRNVVSGNTGYGIVLNNASASGNTVSGNYVGVSAAGTAAIPNAIGIDLEGGANNNTIGGTSVGARNVISGNTQMGVLLQFVGTTGNTVAGNYIGLNAAGSAAIANGTFGVNIKSSATGNTVGGTSGTSGNVISGNTSSGVAIENAASSGNLVQGNTIGLNPAGTSALANGSYGVLLNGAPSNTVGGTSAAARNVISGNTTGGVYILGSGAANNAVKGNYIGLNAAGTAAVPNVGVGVLVEAAPNDTIGGTAAGAGNVISGNGNHGLWLFSTTSGAQVQGNLIGTNAAGTAAIPNTVHGVTISGGASTNTIGGTTASARNVISGNTSSGVRLLGSTTTGNIIRGNYIGVDSTGAVALGNGGFGVIVDGTNTSVGGTADGAGNVIANNGSDGVAVVNTSIGNSILRNSIYANVGLGIDLADDGITLNNGTKNASLPNSDMDFPVFTSAVLNGTTLTVTGHVGSVAGQATFATARVEIFRSSQDLSGNGEGQTFLNFVTTDASGNFSGSVTVAGLNLGDRITGTATDGSNNTSEFSVNVTVVGTTTLGNGTDPGNVSLAPGGAATMAGAFTLQTNSGTDAITAATVTLATGTSAGLSLVEITNDAGTVVYGSVTDPSSDAPSIPLTTNITATTTLTQYKIRVTPRTHANMPAPAGASYAVTARISAWTGTNAQAGSDAAGTTVTIDNLSPGNVTASTATAGLSQVALAWTSPVDADLFSILVLRRTVSAVTDAPVEGATYTIGNTIGSSTVACIFTTPTTNCTDTGLTNGTAYHYRIFARDANGNYSTGVVPTGSPATPVVTTLGNGTDPGNASLAPGGAATMAGAFTLQTSNGTDAITAATVTLATGTSAGLSLVEITNDAGTVVHGSVTNPGSDTPAITLTTNITATTTLTQYKIRITPRTHVNMPAPVGASYAVTARISAWTGTNGQAGSDAAGTTVTIDNLSPGNVTASTATPGGTQVALAWTNPGDADLGSIVVLRRTTSVVTDTPVEGTTYTVGNTIGSSTVACVITAPTASCTDTGLTNGTVYYYRVFARDANGNYATGAVPTGSPATPVAPVLTLTQAASPSGIQPPGTDVTFTSTYTNTGTAGAQGLVIANPVAANTDFKLGSVTSAPGTTGLTVVIAYSSTNGSTWTYTPVSGGGGAPAGYDRLVTNIRWTFTGALSPTAPNNTGSVAVVLRIR